MIGRGRDRDRAFSTGVHARLDAGKQPTVAVDGVWALWLILIGGCVLLALLWEGVLYKVAAEARLEEQAIEKRTTNLARVFEEHTIRTLGAVDQALLFVKYQYEREGDALDIGSALDHSISVSKLYNQVGVIGSDGIYHLSNLPDFSSVDLSDREHFRVHADHDTRTFFLSKPVLGRVSGKWSVQMTRRINQPDGRFGGVAVISIDPFYFTTFYNDVDVGKHGVVTLAGLDGIVRARRAGDSMEVGQDISGARVFELIKRAQFGHGVDASPIDGRVRSYSYRVIENVPLVVIVGLEVEEAMAEFRSRRDAYLAFALSISLVIVGFCGLTLWMVQRLRRLAYWLAEMRLRAASANRLKSEFLASISHELRTPLNGIIGYAELLKESCRVPNLRGYAAVIFDSSQHLLTLLNSILDFARVEAGKVTLSYATHELESIVGEVVATYKAMAQSRGLDLACSVSEGVKIECDRLRVVQVLNNLVHNALKFTYAGVVSLSARVEGDYCVFEVCDTGRGIPVDLHEAIFDRFRQGDDFDTRSQGGTGLGLALCRELAELMGGTVSVRSTPGEGSVFQLTLPLTQNIERNESPDRR